MSTLDFFNLNIKAPIRLERMRRAFATHATRYPNCPEGHKPKSWRDIRGTTHDKVHIYCGDLSRGMNNGEPIWYTHTGPAFRGEQYADEVAPRAINHTGWFTDVHQSGKARGIIARLPHGRVIAGYTWTDNGERVYFPEIFENEIDAALMADEHARVFADNCREDSEKQEAAREIESNIEEALSRVRECLALRNKPCFSELRDEARYLVEQVRKLRAELTSDYADYIF